MEMYIIVDTDTKGNFSSFLNFQVEIPSGSPYMVFCVDNYENLKLRSNSAIFLLNFNKSIY